MHLPDSSDLPVRYSGSAAGNQKQRRKDGTFVLTLMGSLSRMLDQGLSLPVVVETSNKRIAVLVFPLLLAVLQ